MSVIVWDGIYLAADKRAVDHSIGTLTKIKKLESGEIIAFAGETSKGLEMMAWYEAGADKDKYPAFQRTDQFVNFVVAKDFECKAYETTPEPIHVEDKFYAWGSGARYALGALAAGCHAEEAVEIASRFDPNCGNGVNIFNAGAF